jgi:hypothetical protein
VRELMAMSDEAKARVAAASKERARKQREAGAMRAALFCEWSENYAKGNATLGDCPFDSKLASDDDFNYARALGLI